MLIDFNRQGRQERQEAAEGEKGRGEVGNRRQCHVERSETSTVRSYREPGSAQTLSSLKVDSSLRSE